MRSSGPVLDIAELLSVGPGAVGRRAFLAERPAIVAAQERIRAEGIPALRGPGAVEGSSAVPVHGPPTRKGVAARPVVVAGPPQLVRGVTLAARLSVPRVEVCALEFPDADEVVRLQARGALFVVLEGAAWSDDLAEWAVSRGASVAVAGDGHHAPPPRGWWIDDPSIQDARWCALGATARFVAQVCGVDVAAFREASVAGVERLVAAPLLENAAASMALLCTQGAGLLGTPGLASVAAHPRLLPLAAWHAAVWDGAVARLAEPSTGRLVHRDGFTASVAGVVTDTAVHAAVLAGDRMSILWEGGSAPAGTDGPSFAQDLTARAYHALCAAHAVPRLRVRVGALDPAQVGATIALGAMVATYAAALRGASLADRPDTAWNDALRRVSVDDDGPAA